MMVDYLEFEDVIFAKVDVDEMRSISQVMIISPTIQLS